MNVNDSNKWLIAILSAGLGAAYASIWWAFAHYQHTAFLAAGILGGIVIVAILLATLVTASKL